MEFKSRAQDQPATRLKPGLFTRTGQALPTYFHATLSVPPVPPAAFILISSFTGDGWEAGKVGVRETN